MSHATPPPGPPSEPSSGTPGEPPGPYPGPHYQPPPTKKSRTGLWIALGVVSLLLLVCAGGCVAFVGNTAQEVDKALTSPSVALPDSTDGPGDSPAADAGSNAAKFGATVTTKENEAITLVYLGSRLTTESDLHNGPQARVQRFKVTMKNGSSGPIQVNPFNAQATYGPEGQVAEQNLGAAGGSVTVAPGRVGTATLEFITPKTFKGTMAVTVQTSIAGDSAIFEGQVK